MQKHSPDHALPLFSSQTLFSLADSSGIFLLFHVLIYQTDWQTDRRTGSYAWTLGDFYTRPGTQAH